MTGSMKASKFLTKFLFYAGNIIIGIIFVSPLIWMISASLKPEAEIFANMNSIATFIPVDASLNNFAEVFSRLNMAQVFKNTLVYIALILVFEDEMAAGYFGREEERKQLENTIAQQIGKQVSVIIKEKATEQSFEEN